MSQIYGVVLFKIKLRQSIVTKCSISYRQHIFFLIYIKRALKMPNRQVYFFVTIIFFCGNY